MCVALAWHGLVSWGMSVQARVARSDGAARTPAGRRRPVRTTGAGRDPFTGGAGWRRR
ncbi:uncharacterized protein BCN122_II1290 [Burkholderia cenocepacia]|nr:uncharacterized protein BCN122_II1290 [Burkholderia cenocepacia]